MFKITDGQKFVILTTPRTGSTFLNGLLHSHPHIICKAELLHPSLRKDPVDKYLQSTIWNEKDKAHIYVKAKGFKLHYEHIRGLDDLNYFKNNNTKVIHLIRKNTLNVVLSMKLTRKIGVWGGVEYPVEPFEINPTDLLTRMLETELRIEQFSKVAEEFDHMTIYYEDLCENKDYEMERCFTFLGVDFVPTRCKSIKQRTHHQGEYISNYQELKEYFSHGKYGAFFED